MPIRNLHKIFQPRRVAVIGASRKKDSLGSKVLDNLQEAGFSGAIYAVNPKYKKIGDAACYAKVTDLPDPPDLAVVCTPARTVPEIVQECGRAGIFGLVVLSAGFRESGKEGEELERAVRREAEKFDGLRIVGPNCLGIIAPHAALNASFAGGMPAKGHVAFISQSGALCTSVLDWALKEKIGFSHFVSVGNTVDVSIGDLIDYFAGDGRTESIILYVESINEAREFMSAARAFAPTSPSSPIRPAVSSNPRGQRPPIPGPWPVSIPSTRPLSIALESCASSKWSTCSIAQNCWPDTSLRKVPDWQLSPMQAGPE